MSLHKGLNRLVKAKGLVADRGNSLFASGRAGQASNYGTVYALYPIGDFNYTWAPAWADAYSDIKMSNNMMWKPSTIKKLPPDKIEELRAKVLEYSEDSIKNLKMDLVSYEREMKNYENDIEQSRKNGTSEKHILSMVQSYNSAKRHYLETEKKIRREEENIKDPKFIMQRIMQYAYDYDVIDDIKSKDKKFSIKSFLNDYGDEFRGDDGSIKQAIESGVEVYIKCDYAYYIEKGFFEDYVKPLLSKKLAKKDTQS